YILFFFIFFFSSRRRHTRFSRDWSSDVCSSDLTSSILEPVSIKAVAMILNEPPFSIFLAAPKNRFGFCKALASTPPESTFPEARSEERRVGKECRSRWWQDREKSKKKSVTRCRE